MHEMEEGCALESGAERPIARIGRHQPREPIIRHNAKMFPRKAVLERAKCFQENNIRESQMLPKRNISSK